MELSELSTERCYNDHHSDKKYKSADFDPFLLLESTNSAFSLNIKVDKESTRIHDSRFNCNYFLITKIFSSIALDVQIRL